MPPDWRARFAGLNAQEICELLTSLPSDSQIALDRAITQREAAKAAAAVAIDDAGEEDLFPPPNIVDPPPWTVGGGSVHWILEELKLTSLYGQTFDEYGVTSAEQ